jgi:hypothetical protein
MYAISSASAVESLREETNSATHQYCPAQTATMKGLQWWSLRGHMSDDEKQDSQSKDTFLNTAARAVGSTLGKLATKAGLAGPGEQPKVPVPARRVPRKKKAAGKLVRKPRKAAERKKKVAPKKTARVATKSKR